jgi:hypothetical protein
VRRASATRIGGDKNEVCIPQRQRKSNNKAADRKSRGLIAMLLGWYPNAYSFAGVTLFLTLVPHGHLLSWPPLWNFRAAAKAK